VNLFSLAFPPEIFFLARGEFPGRQSKLEIPLERMKMILGFSFTAGRTK
jgi:hypothetical protein